MGGDGGRPPLVLVVVVVVECWAGWGGAWIGRCEGGGLADGVCGGR